MEEILGKKLDLIFGKIPGQMLGIILGRILGPKLGMRSHTRDLGMNSHSFLLTSERLLNRKTLKKCSKCWFV